MSRPVVLIADDDEEVALLLRTYLKPLDVDVLVARDGEEALAIAQSRLPAVVILVTGRGDVKDRLTGLQVGADDYLVKPFDRNEVMKRVRAVLARAPELRKDAAHP